MTLSLLDLSENEHEVLKRTVYRLNGKTSDKSDWNDAKLLLNNYSDIHQAYLNLYKETGDVGIKTEALKRLIFINWQYMVQSAALTGINELDETVIVDSYSLLNECVKQNDIDLEFTWMLNHYAV